MTFDYQTYCCKDNLQEIRDFIRKSLSNLPFSEVEVNNFTLSVDEVCANRIIHANNCNPKGFLQVKINYLKGKMIEFSIRDNGSPFPFEKYEEPLLSKIITSGKKGGIGLLIVNKIMDDVVFKQDQESNICLLTKIL